MNTPMNTNDKNDLALHFVKQAAEGDVAAALMSPIPYLSSMHGAYTGGSGSKGSVEGALKGWGTEAGLGTVGGLGGNLTGQALAHAVRGPAPTEAGDTALHTLFRTLKHRGPISIPIALAGGAAGAVYGNRINQARQAALESPLDKFRAMLAAKLQPST